MIRRIGFAPSLIVLAGVALALRLIGLDWDQGLYLHPDERFMVWVTTDLRWPSSVGQYFDTAASPLNPYNTQHGSFIYGTFPSFLVKSIASVFGMDTYGQLYLVGRIVSAVADTGTVVLTAMLGRRFFGDRAGLLAGLLLAFTPLFLQSAHFFTVDTIATFFAVAAFACVVASWDRASIGWMAVAGVMIGLAGASKPNLLVTLAFLSLPMLETVRLHGWSSLIPRLHERIYPAIPAAVTGGFLAFWTFRLAQPYAFAGPNVWTISLNQQWLDDLAFWRAVQVGLVDMKPSIQWIDRTPIVYILQNLVLWGMGPMLGLASMVGLALAVWRILRSNRWPSWWWIGIVGWCLANIAIYSTGIAQNQRYLMQMYPFLIILAAGMLMELLTRWPRTWMGHLLIAVVVMYTVVYGVAFDSLYVRPITRIEASEWIYENLPEGAVISNEYWDDALPMPLPGQDRSLFPGMTLDLYGDESEDSQKVSVLVAQLSQVDYIVLSSNRVIDSVIRQPERYPVAVRYYEMLLDGDLGFELVADFTQGPEIFGIEWDDRSAEESLTVYEHPQVRIFKTTDSFNAQQVYSELNDAWGYGGYHFIPGDPKPDQMLMSDADLQTNIDKDVGTGFKLARDHPVVFWWVTMQLVAIAAWPVTWRAFRNLPDAGWMLAKGIGLLGMAAITMALVQWRSFLFTPGTIALSLLLLLSIGLAAPRSIWNQFRLDIERQWRQIAIGEALFSLTFLAIALLRSYQVVLPDQQMMLLSGTMRSATLPPLDPWLSGGILHAHWVGVLPWAAMGKLLTLDPSVVYNLATITVYAVLAGVVWSILNSLTQSWIAIFTALAVVWGSSSGFDAGIAPSIVGTSIDLATLMMVLISAVLLHGLMLRHDQRILPTVLVALAAGALSVTVGWGLIAALVMVLMGLAIVAWQHREPADMWWPIVRRFVLETVAVIGGGLVIWYPAYIAFTATQRNLASPALWSVNSLGSELGLVLILTFVVASAGAIRILGLTLEEGSVGIITSGVALGALIAFAVLAWRLDSAMAVLLLVSLLTVIAAWHWLHQFTMLWSVGCILFGTGLLIVAQTRPFHFDTAGVSSSRQLIPLAWMLFIVAIALAASHFITTAPIWARKLATLAAALVTIALLIPTVSYVQRTEWKTSPSSLANPAILMSEGEIKAARWMQQEFMGMPVILTAAGTGSDNIGAISALTGQPTVLGWSEAERRMRPGWESMVEDRNTDVTEIYTQAAQWHVVSPLLERYDVRYIVIGPMERLKYGPTVEQSFATAERGGHLELVYQSEGVSIYRVLQEPPAKAD